MAACPTLVAVDERVVGDQSKSERRGLVHQRGMQVHTIERGFGLRECRFEEPEIADTERAAGDGQQPLVEFDHFTQREVAHQARRRYNSAFFRRTRSAAV